MSKDKDDSAGCLVIAGIILGLFLLVALIGLVIDFWRYWGIPAVGIITAVSIGILIHSRLNNHRVLSDRRGRIIMTCALVSLLLYVGCEAAAQTGKIRILRDGTGIWRCASGTHGFLSEECSEDTSEVGATAEAPVAAQ